MEMSWHRLDKLGTPFEITLIVVHRSEFMESGVVKYGVREYIPAWPSLQISLHCSWDIFNDFWIRTIRWDDIHDTRRWPHLRLSLFFNNLLHDTRRWLHLRLLLFLKRLHLRGLKCRLSTMCN